MNLLNAPITGIMYALYKDRMVFERYERENLMEDELEENLLELHLFDQNKEYRWIHSQRGDIETIVSGEQADDTYLESVYTVNPNIPKVEIINYLTYDENDLMIINNYRLKEVEK